MSIPVRYIFGCSHSKKDIHTEIIFENGFRLPVAFCENCIDANETRLKSE
ncbi:MAG: hypothetical protein R3237_05430 [Nitrosopumilaceae archaeon]|nr:hypothetical protein [Nitrosopumilaceae archaeon]